jgi:predicted neuraminidase
MVDTPGFPDCNTCLMIDPQQRLWLFWPVVIANSWESCITHYLTSDRFEGDTIRWNSNGIILLKPNDFQSKVLTVLDQHLARLPRPLTDAENAELKEARERLGDKLYQRLGWQPRCKPTILASGRILLPLYSDTFSISIMAISDDQGRSWYASEPLIGMGNIQPTVLRRNNGTLVAYMRENGQSSRVRTCESPDDGMTWGTVGQSELPNPGSGLDGVRLRNGHWLLIYNDTEEKRNSLAVSISDDEGQTWRWTRHVERHEEGSYHYPAVIQGRDDSVHIVYSYFVPAGKSMKHARFNEEWVQQGD